METELPIALNSNRIVKGVAILALAGLLPVQACATNPITTDALPQLQPGEGIAGISFDSAMELVSIQFVAASGDGTKLRIPDVPVMQGIFLFVAPAGRYCIESYSFAQNGVDLSSTSGDQCFEVEAGKLSYSGTFVLRFNKRDVLSGEPLTHWHHWKGLLTKQDRSSAFLNALSLSYPHIASAMGSSIPDAH